MRRDSTVSIKYSGMHKELDTRKWRVERARGLVCRAGVRQWRWPTRKQREARKGVAESDWSAGEKGEDEVVEYLQLDLGGIEREQQIQTKVHCSVLLMRCGVVRE